MPIFRPATSRMVFFLQFQFFGVYKLFKNAILKLPYRRKKVHQLRFDEQEKSIYIKYINLGNHLHYKVLPETS